MRKQDRPWVIGADVIITIFALLLSLVAIGVYNTSVVQGRIISINRTWQGGDQTNYENVTISYHNQTMLFTFSCNYYTLNSSVPIQYTKPFWFFPSSLGPVSADSYPPGCDT